MENTNKTPICPLMSASKDVPMICAEENCAWYIKNYKTCAVYIMAHNAALDIQLKQG